MINLPDPDGANDGVNTTKTSELLKSFLIRVAAARVVILLFFHAFVFTACYVIAWLVRFEFHLPQQHVGLLQSSLPYVVMVQLLVAIGFGFLRGWWRYVGIADVLRLVAGTVTALAILNVLWYVVDVVQFTPLVGVSRGVLLVDWAFALLTLFGARVLVRLGKDFARLNDEESAGVKKVLIVGAGDAGEALAREIQHRPQLGIRVVGFIDDHRAKWNSNIRGIKVRGPISKIGRIAEETGATEALLAIPSASGKRMREIVRQLAGAELKFRTIPGMDQLVSGKVHVTQLRTVNVDDLLRRTQVVVSADRVRAFFNRKKIVITGAGGSVGSELVLQVLQYAPAELHLIERSEMALYECLRRLGQEAGSRSNVIPHLLDCADSAALLAEVRPDIVIHAAAHKHVPMGEENPLEYVRNNAVVARRFAESCEAASVQRFVFISTDKAIRPSSVMGASKRAAEIALLDLAKRTSMKMMVVRFGNVIGSSGSVVPLFLQQIAGGGPVTVTHPNVTRYFLRTSEAISLILQAAALGDDRKVYMLDMGDPIPIVELARDLIQLSNHSVEDIPIIYIGLRPGEKLHEEIRAPGDAIFSSEHPHIIGIEVPQPAEKEVESWYRELERAILVQSPHILEVLTRLIPEYSAPALPPVSTSALSAVVSETTVN